MENTILDFTKVYENFTGSGNINGKYWIVGLESGGKLAPNENSNKYVGTINNGNELEIILELNKATGRKITQNYEE